MEDRLVALGKYLQVIANPADEQELDEAIPSIRLLLDGPKGLQLLGSMELQPFFVEGLQHPNKDVQLLALSQLIRCTEHPHLLHILEDPQVWQSFFTMLASDYIPTAERVVKILQQLATSPEGLKMVFRENVVAALKNLMGQSGSVKFRVLDVMSTISSYGGEAFKLCATSGFLEAIIGSLNTTDVLEKLNGIELLDKVTESSEGIQYLEETNTINKLHSLLTDQSDPMNSLLIPRVMQFLGSFSTKGDKQVNFLAQHGVVKDVKKIMEEQGNNPTKEAAIVTVADIGSTPTGFKLLQENGIFPDYLSYINVEAEDIRLACMHCLGKMLTSLGKEPNGQVERALEEVFSKAPKRNGEQVPIVQIVIPLLEQPFSVLRYAIFHLITGLVCHEWGVKFLLEYPGFVEFLLNRNTEETKAGKEWKFTIIQSLVKTSKRMHTNMDKTTQQALTLYLKQGVFFIEAEAALEIESQTT